MPSDGKYRACVVGLTGIAAGRGTVEGQGGFGPEMPHSHLGGYAFLPQTEVVGVCDLVEERVDECMDNWSSVFPRMKGYADYREMIAEQQPELLSVVTSDHQHADIVVHATEAGVRGLFCEKPIATCLADADRMIEAVERHQVVVNVNHTRRWRPIFRQVREEARKGTIGELQRITLHFGGPRAMLFRNGTHKIDLICFLAEADPQWVFAELDEGYEEYWPYQGDGGRNPDLEPGCSGYIHFANGVRAFYNGSKGLSPWNGCELTGTAGWIRVDESCAQVGTAAGVRHLASAPLTRTDAPAAIGEIIQVMEQGGETISPLREARKSLEVILGFLASQKKGNARIDFPLDESAV